MSIYKKLTLTVLSIGALAACSPPEPPAENFMQGHKQSIDKAKNVEKVILEQTKTIDRTIDQATHE